MAIRPLLAKLIAPLTPTEQVTLLAGMAGGSFDELKRTTPTLAFVGFWPDEKLSILLSRAQTDEVVAFLRVRPELRERLLSLCPPMTAEVGQDELSRPDMMSEAERNRLLTVLSERLKEMVANQEVDLSQIFKSSPPGPQASGDEETILRDDSEAA